MIQKQLRRLTMNSRKTLNKKISVWVILFCYITTGLFAGGYIKKGEAFVAEEDVRYFNYSESLDVLRATKQAKNLKEQVALLKDIVADKEKELEKYKQAAEKSKKAIEKYEQASEQNKLAIQDFKQSIVKLETSNKETKEAAFIYKEVVTTQTEALRNCLKSLGSEKSKRRFERKFYYWLGVLTPIVAGAALKQIKF